MAEPNLDGIAGASRNDVTGAVRRAKAEQLSLWNEVERKAKNVRRDAEATATAYARAARSMGMVDLSSFDVPRAGIGRGRAMFTTSSAGVTTSGSTSTALVPRYTPPSPVIMSTGHSSNPHVVQGSVVGAGTPAAGGGRNLMGWMGTGARAGAAGLGYLGLQGLIKADESYMRSLTSTRMGLYGGQRFDMIGANRTGMLNSQDLFRGMMASSSMGFAPGTAGFNQNASLAGTLAQNNPGLGRAGAMAGMTNLITPTTSNAARTIGIRTMNSNGSARDPSMIAADLMKTLKRPGVGSITSQDVAQSMRVGGSLSNALNYLQLGDEAKSMVETELYRQVGGQSPQNAWANSKSRKAASGDEKRAYEQRGLEGAAVTLNNAATKLNQAAVELYKVAPALADAVGAVKGVGAEGGGGLLAAMGGGTQGILNSVFGAAAIRSIFGKTGVPKLGGLLNAGKLGTLAKGAGRFAGPIGLAAYVGTSLWDAKGAAKAGWDGGHGEGSYSDLSFSRKINPITAAAGLAGLGDAIGQGVSQKLGWSGSLGGPSGSAEASSGDMGGRSPGESGTASPSKGGGGGKTRSLLRPCGGRITSGYGMRFNPARKIRSFHTGIDFGVGTGTPIKAAESGTVSQASFHSGYGNKVVIQHGGGLATMYAHLSRFAVRSGGSVRRGQIIGYSGSTGKWTTGPHLHFEVWRNGAPTDPNPYLSAGGGAMGSSANTVSSTGQDSGSSGFSVTAAGVNAILSTGMTGVSSSAMSAAGVLGSDAGWMGAAGSGPSSSASGTPSAGSFSGSMSSNMKLGQQMASQMGWSGSEWNALRTLWMKESGWRTNADNPTSSAYGIPQAMMSIHFKDPKKAKQYMSDPGTQIRWGLNYIKGRYGDPESALAFHNKHNYYASGQWEIAKDQIAKLHKGEMVVPAPAAENLRSAIASGSAGGSKGGGVSIGQIIVQVKEASDAEAVRFARKIKAVIEDDADIESLRSS